MPVNKFYDLISINMFKFKIKGTLIFILNHLDTRMVTETRHLCENIRTVRGQLSCFSLVLKGILCVDRWHTSLGFIV